MAPFPQFAKFWMVCRKPTGPRSNSEPRVRYATFEDAMAAPRKLAKETGHQFHILETVATARPEGAEQGSLL
ncbi:hypothetical protein [Pseudosulfitobacter pseudonitzschiae]|uniref:hypothetical protein n=1 Tax=Pseudosulfitobacter pseudonitzschiae TaxID=1402135 RepID=UPI003B76D1A7